MSSTGEKEPAPGDAAAKSSAGEAPKEGSKVAEDAPKAAGSSTGEAAGGEAKEPTPGSKAEGGSKVAEEGKDAAKAEGSKADVGSKVDGGEGGEGKDGDAPKDEAGSKADSKAPAAGGKGRKRGKNEKATVDNVRIGILGAGKMAEAIVRGLLFQKFTADRIVVSSKNGKTHDTFKQLQVTVTKRLYDVFGRYESDMIFLCMHGLAIKECFTKGGQRPLALATNYIPLRGLPYYILSLVGGVTMEEVKKVLLNPDNPEKYKGEFRRVMLNTAIAFGVGIGAIDVEIDSKKLAPIVRDVMCKLAKMEYFPEANMDVLCAVGGNGLAFVYYFVAAMADGGFKMGLPKKLAVSLATKTLNSAALTLLESGKSTAELRDACACPSGPAIFGLAALDKKDAAHGLANAVDAAFKRLRELVEKPLT